MTVRSIACAVLLLVALGGCGAEPVGPQHEPGFRASLSGDYARTLTGTVTMAGAAREEVVGVTAPDGVRWSGILLQEGVPGRGGSGISFTYPERVLEPGEHGLGPDTGSDGGRIIASYTEFRDGGLMALHIARKGSLRIEAVDAQGVRGTFSFQVDRYLILDPSAGRQNAEDVPSGAVRLTVTGSFAAAARR